MSEYIGKRYQIVKLIGRGGMADVYLALDTILNREVAVKVLKADMSSDAVALERFNREAIASTQLSHPNIVDVYDVGEDGDQHYIVMEYIKGYTLKQLIKKRGRIPYKEAIWMMKQLTGALMEAHRKGIIHRDVKSQNILIKDDGTIKITDFGIAIAHGAMQITSKDSILGSVHYLAPELTKGAHATMQSDIYSLGIVFYEMLSGDVPFKADTAVQVALQHIKSQMPSIRSMDSSIPQSVENIVIKCTAKNVENRYKNTALLLKDLNDCLNPSVLWQDKLILDEKIEPITFKNSTSNENKTTKKVVEEKKKKENKNPFFKKERKEKVEVIENDDDKNESSSLFLIIFLVCISILSAFILIAVLYLSGVVGKTKSEKIVPQIVSLSVQEASDLLSEQGLELDTANIEWILTDNVSKGKIISCSPSEGSEVEAGSKIKIVASKGTYEIMGNYVGKNYSEAGKSLEALGFSVKYESIASNEEAGIVVSQSIAENEKYDPSARLPITLQYSAFTNFTIPVECKGKSLEEFLTYLNDAGISYELVKKEKSDFTSTELEGCGSQSVVLTDPIFGLEYTIEDYPKVYVYYYEEE